MFSGLNFINSTRKQIRTSRKLKNIILSIIFCSSYIFKFFVQFLKNVSVGKYENHIFFWKAIKIAGSAQKTAFGQVSGNTGICFLGLSNCYSHKKFINRS